MNILAYTSSSDVAMSSSAAGALGLIGGFYILMICVYVIMIAYSMFGMVITTISIIDIAKRSNQELPDKTMWILLMYPFGTWLLFIPAMVYFFSKRKQLG